MFNVGQHALIVPCSEIGARAWSAGKISDAELILHFAQPVEAFYFASLPALRGWRGAVRQMLSLCHHGARIVVVRTNNRVVRNYVTSMGGRETHYDGEGFAAKVRYVIEAEHVEAKAEKFKSFLRGEREKDFQRSFFHGTRKHGERPKTKGKLFTDCTTC